MTAAPNCSQPDFGTPSPWTKIATLQARVEELTADCAHISARWIAETRHNEELTKALRMARARIEYLGVCCLNSMHFESNEKTFLPAIDEALAMPLKQSGSGK